MFDPMKNADRIGEDTTLKITDLISNLNDANAATNKIKQQLHDFQTKKGRLPEVVSEKLQAKTERQTNYKIITKDVSKWQNIVKKNREIEHLDLTNKIKDSSKRINANQKHFKRTTMTTPLEEKLKELKQASELDLKKGEEKIMSVLTPKEQKEKLSELAKRKNLLFYQEIKQKRISKIKSKLYHKIKNKKLRAEAIKKGVFDSEFKTNELEKAVQKRAEERISLRHKLKSKYVKNLIKYGGDSKEIKKSINEADQIRKSLLKKINNFKENSDSEDLLDLEDPEANQKLISELESEFLGSKHNSEIQKATGFKFIDRFIETRDQKLKNEAENLINKLREEKDENEAEEEDEEEENQEKGEKFLRRKEERKEGGRRRKSDGEEEKEREKDEDAEWMGRGSFKRKKEKEGKEEEKKQEKKFSALEIIDKFIREEGEMGLKEEGQKEKENKDEKGGDMVDEKDLLSGLNVDNLNKKYHKKELKKINKSELEKIMGGDMEIEQFDSKLAFVENNKTEFEQEKMVEMETEKPLSPKNLKGWGNWTGAGVKDKADLSESDKQAKRQKQIQEIKKTRADGNLNNIIINEKRNKKVAKFLVSELPQNFKSKEQFNFLNNIPLGTEWNLMISHQNMVKPSLKTKKGEIIAPIKYEEIRKRK